MNKTNKYHNLLANYFQSKPLYWDEPNLEKPNTRRLVEQPWQLIKGELWDEVTETLCNLDFIQANGMASHVFKLIGDYRLALGELPEMKEELLKGKKNKENIERWTREIIEYSRKWNERRDKLLKGEVVGAELEPYQPNFFASCEIWSDERIQKERERMINSTNRRDRIEAFAHFIGTQSYTFIEHGKRPGFVKQLAYNTGPQGIVHQASLKYFHDDDDQPETLLRTWPVNSLFNPMNALIGVLTDTSSGRPKGHPQDLDRGINTLDYSPLREWAISAGCDNLVKLWDIRSGNCLNVLKGHLEEIYTVAITPDGTRAISAGKDKVIKVWNLDSGKCNKNLEGHSEVITSVRITSDGRRCVSVSADKTIRVWDLDHGICENVLIGSSQPITCVDITPSGRIAVTGGMDEMLHVWDLENSTCIKSFMVHDKVVWSVRIDFNGGRAISTSLDMNVRIWDLTNGDCLHTLPDHRSPGRSVSFTPDGRRAITASEFPIILVWDCESWDCIKELKGHNEIISSVCISPDGRRAISGSWDESIRVWNLENGCSDKLTDGHRDVVASISTDPSGKFAISASSDKTIKIWNLENYKCVRTLQGHKDPVTSVSIHPNGHQAMSASYDKTLKMWNLKDGQELFSLDASKISVLCVDIAPDGRRAVSSGDDGFIHLWDIETRRPLMSQMNEKFGIICVKFTPDGQDFVWGSDKAVLRIDTTDYLKYKDPEDIPIELHGHNDWITDISITPDGRFAASVSRDGSLCFWDIKSGLLLRKIYAHSKRITGINISSDGRLAFSVSWDHSLRIWNLDNGKCVAVFFHLTPLESVAICPKTSVILCGTLDGEIIFLKNPMISLGLKAIKKNTLQEYSTYQTISGHNGVQNYPFDLVLSDFAEERQLMVGHKRLQIDFFNQKFESVAGIHSFWRKDYEKKYSSEPYLDFRKHIRFGGYEILNESVDDRSRFEFNVALYLEKDGKKFSVLYKAIHEAPQVGWSVSIHLFDEDLCNNEGNKANARRAYVRYRENTRVQDNEEKWRQQFMDQLDSMIKKTQTTNYKDNNHNNHNDQKANEQLNFEAAEKAFKKENWETAYNLYLKLVQQGKFDANHMRYNMAICRLNSLTSINQEIINDIDILVVLLKDKGANDKAKIITEKLKERLDALKQEELAKKKALPWWKKIF